MDKNVISQVLGALSKTFLFVKEFCTPTLYYVFEVSLFYRFRVMSIDSAVLECQQIFF
jgi:hypothetical protein